MVKRKWCLMDLILDTEGRMSATAVWFNIGNIALTIGFCRTVWDHPLTYDLILAYGTIVCGNKIAMEAMRKRKNALVPASKK